MKLADAVTADNWQRALLSHPAVQERIRRRASQMLAEKKQAEALARPVEWITKHFWIPELKGPIVLYPYQRAVLREAYRRDADGRFVYDLVVWSDIKKSAKSTIAAAVTLHRAMNMSWGSIHIVANDLKQADSRVAYYLRRAIEMNPSMGKRIKQIRYRTEFPNNTIVEAIPIDPAGEAGGNDDLIVFSELWAAKHAAIQQMWTEMTLSPTKYGHSQRWVETYAGYSGESPILENLYEQGVGQGERLDLSYTADDGTFQDLSDLEVYRNGGLLCLWNTEPRLPWQTKKYYASESRTLVPAEFDRIHRNLWVSSLNQFVPDQWWNACRGDLPELKRINEPMIAGMDAATSRATFGIVLCSGHDDPGPIVVRYARKWAAPVGGGKIDFQGTKENPGPEIALRRLCEHFNIVEVRYDPYQLHDMATRLQKEGIAKFEEFSQQSGRLKADRQLYDRIRERGIIHNGNHDLGEHIQNANAKLYGDEDRKMRLVARSENHPIDLAVALSQAAYSDKEEPKKTVKIGGK